MVTIWKYYSSLPNVYGSAEDNDFKSHAHDITVLLSLKYIFLYITRRFIPSGDSNHFYTYYTVELACVTFLF